MFNQRLRETFQVCLSHRVYLRLSAFISGFKKTK